jgi:DNA-binding LacI/PurR family transcriptional regulator
MRKPQKALRLIDYLEEQLLAGRYPAGSRLPSVRRLTGKFDMSYSSALRGIDYLCAKGVLEKSAKRGIFVRKHGRKELSASEKRILVLVVPYSQGQANRTGMYYTALNGMQELALDKGYSLVVTPYNGPQNSNEKFPVELCDGCGGVIMLREYDLFYDDIQLNIPVVGILVHKDFNGKNSIVDLDPFNAANSAVKYFKSRNCKNVTIVTDFRPTYINRGRIFQSEWCASGGIVEDFIVSRIPEVDSEIEFSSDCGYLFTSDHLLQRYSLEYQERKGITLAEDQIVLGIDGKSMISPEFHKFPTIAVDWKRIGECALEECIARMEHPGRCARRLYIPGHLVNVKNK